jgi:hypothetical protein
MRGLEFMADQQASPDRDTTDPGNQRSLEAVAGQQLSQPRRVLHQRSSGALKKRSEPQSRDHLDVALVHWFDYRVHRCPEWLILFGGKLSPQNKTAGAYPGGSQSVSVDQ